MNANFELHLLLPADHLPAEGHEPGAFTGAHSESELIGWFVQQLPSPAIAFAVSENGVEISQPVIDLRHARLVWQRDEADTPWVDPSGARVEVSLEEAFAEDDLALRYPGEERSPEDWLRGLLGKIRSFIEPALCGFRGMPLPLLEWVAGSVPGSGHAIFHGVWLADPATLTQLKRWDAEADLGLILEEADVEGRGLREVLAAALMMGVVFGGQSASAADNVNASGRAPERPGLVSALRGLFGKKDEAPAAAGTTANATAKAEKKAERKSSSSSQTAKVQVVRQAPAKIDDDLLKSACDENVKVVVEISKQRAYLLVDGQVAIDTPISSASAGRWTPRGTFAITEKVRTGKMSTIYKCPLPFWMRLGETAVGMHIGDLPGYPASHGCVRLPREIAPILFEHTFRGTQVQVVDAWSPAPPAAATELVAKQ